MRRAEQLILDYGVLPVLSVDRQEDAIPLADALAGGGLPLIEITLRTPAALESIRLIKSERPGMLVGAGTVTSFHQAEEAVAAGADFVVSPGYDEAVVRECLERGYSIIPACSTSSEVMRGAAAGLKILKFFPAEQLGGLKAIKLLAGPFPGVRFLPTGGISGEQLAGYLRDDSIAACGGSFIAKKGDILEKRFDVIRDNCVRAIDASLGFELAHVGINLENETEALEAASLFGKRFRLPIKNGNRSVFAGQAVELMKFPYLGERGHIGFYTNSVRRALAFFKREGIQVDETTVRTDKAGMASFYLRDLAAGFAVHVVRRP